MIVNLNGVVHGDFIDFNLCPMYFESNQFVHVNELFIQWKTQAKNVHGYIESSLIDQSSVNLKQQLLFFHQRKESNYIYYTPTHLSKYKIQCSSLHGSVFKIHLSEKHQIEKIYLQLEISNARF